jgi:hypothetical protein
MRKVMLLGILLLIMALTDAYAVDYFSWETRTDRYGKTAGIFDVTPFPIDETTESYVFRSDEFPEGKTYNLGTKYYVDAGSGDDMNSGLALSKPKKTIQSAIQAAGDGSNTIIVRNGIYMLTTPLVPGAGEDDTHRLMIVGYGQERPIIDGSLCSENMIMGGNRNAHYLTLQRLKLQNSRYEGIGFHDDSNINIIDVWIYNAVSDTPIEGDGNMHLHMVNRSLISHVTSEHTYDHCYKFGDDDNNIIVEWSVAKECGYWNGIPKMTTGTACGFDFPSDAPQEPSGMVLRYSIAHDVLFNCAQIRRQNNFSVHHNEFYNCPNMDAVSGERSHATNEGSVLVHQSSWGKMYANVIRAGPDGEGTADSQCTDCLAIGLGLQSNSPHESWFYNNVFYDIAQPIFVYGYSDDTIEQHYRIFSNSVYGSSGKPLVRMSEGAVDANQDSVEFSDNIIYQAATGSAVELDSDVVRHGNLYYAPRGAIGVVQGSDELATDPLWRALPGGSYKPSFFALTNTSLALDTASGSLLTDSFNGVVRPSGAGWDRGAYEFDGTGSCIYPDENGLCSACVTSQELVRYLDLWRNGSVSLTNLIKAIAQWKACG